MDKCDNGVCLIEDVQKINNAGYGLTKYGFRRKLYPECVADRIARAKKVFGVNIDTSETSFLGKLIRNLSWDEAYIWELAEEVYTSPFVNSAEGTALDNVGMYLTISRRPATRSKVILTVYGDDETIVHKGFRVATKSGVIFETIEDAIITGGKVNIPAVSIGAGKEFNVLDKTITEIVNPTFGVNKVENAEKAEGGLDIETDNEFRERYKKSYSRVGGSTVPAITAALLDIDKVVDCEVRENVTMETIAGIPPKSIACYVFGGEDEEIAQTIYQNKAAGIQAFGDKYVSIQDKKTGVVTKIGFTRAKVVDTYVKLKLKKGENYKGDDAVKRAILNYIGGADTDGINYRGLKLGEDVVFSKVVGAVMCLGGVDDVEVELSTDGKTYKPESLVIESASIARTAPSRIVISYA